MFPLEDANIRMQCLQMAIGYVYNSPVQGLSEYPAQKSAARFYAFASGLGTDAPTPLRTVSGGEK